MPPTSRPAPYGQKGLRKIAILMTDGEYNTQYDNGMPVSERSAPNGSSTEQARALCAYMKAASLLVYTIGFESPRGGQSVETLRQCASDESMFFNADNGDALRQAFRDIAP